MRTKADRLERSANGTASAFERLGSGARALRVRMLTTLLVREGWQTKLKRVCRFYHEEGLSLRLKTKKKRSCERPVPLSRPAAPNECWSMDFVH